MAINQSYALISNGVATGTPQKVAGGLYSFAVVASAFGGASVKLQILGPDQATYLDIDATLSFTANGIQAVDLPGGGTVRATVTGGPPTAVYATLSLVRQ